MADQQILYWKEVLWPEKVDFLRNEGIILPSGPTIDRPSPADTGTIRFNTDTNQFEGFFGASWASIAAGGVTFTDLTDTPSSFTTFGNQVLRVNSAETDLEFTDALVIENTGRLTVAATANYETLVTTDDTIPNKKFVDDQDALRVAKAGDSMDSGANLIFSGGGTINGLPQPTTAQQAANKEYVDALSAGLDPKESVRVATTDILDNVGNGTWTRSGSGTGKTLTAGAVGTTTLDGEVLADGDRVLVKDEDGTGVNLTASDNGIYVASDTGAGTATVLTRASDQDGTPTNEVSGGNFTFVEQGSTLEGTGWTVVANGTVAIDADDMIWTQFSGVGVFLPLAGGTMDPSSAIVLDTGATIQLDETATAAAPTLTFDGDTDTGIFWGGINEIAFATGGTHRWSIDASGNLIPAATITYDIGQPSLKVLNVYSDRFIGNVGAAGDPTYSFDSDSGTGMYRSAINELSFATGGTQQFRVESDGTLSVLTASYESQVTLDNDIPNKKFVDDSIAAITAFDDADGDTKIDVEEGADDDTIRMDVGPQTGFDAQADVFLLRSSDWTVDLGSNTAGAGAPISLSAGDSTVAAGGNVTIGAGTGTTDGVIDFNTAGTTQWTINSSGDLVGASGNNITLAGGGDIRFEESGAGTDFIAFQAPAAITTSFTLTLPDADAATNGEVLASDAAGNLSFNKLGFIYSSVAGDGGGGPSTSHVISHNLGQKFVTVQVYDTSDNWLVPDDIELTDANTVTITLSISLDIRAVIIGVPGLALNT